jgi:SpoVK/Ycf46/Vps4 family AAA+-type ATPase
MKTLLTKEHYSHLVEVKQELKKVLDKEREFYYDVLMWEDNNEDQVKLYKAREERLKYDLQDIESSLRTTRESLTSEQLKEYRDYHKSK